MTGDRSANAHQRLLAGRTYVVLTAGTSGPWSFGLGSWAVLGPWVTLGLGLSFTLGLSFDLGHPSR